MDKLTHKERTIQDMLCGIFCCSEPHLKNSGPEIKTQQFDALLYMPCGLRRQKHRTPHAQLREKAEEERVMCLCDTKH